MDFFKFEKFLNNFNITLYDLPHYIRCLQISNYLKQIHFELDDEFRLQDDFRLQNQMNINELLYNELRPNENLSAGNTAFKINGKHVCTFENMAHNIYYYFFHSKFGIVSFKFSYGINTKISKISFVRRYIKNGIRIKNFIIFNFGEEGISDLIYQSNDFGKLDDFIYDEENNIKTSNNNILFLVQSIQKIYTDSGDYVNELDNVAEKYYNRNDMNEYFIEMLKINLENL